MPWALDRGGGTYLREIDSDRSITLYKLSNLISTDSDVDIRYL